MKNILVTGLDSFVGSHLVVKIIKKAYKVIVFCLYKSLSGLGWLYHLSIAVKMEIDIFLLLKNLTEWDAIYADLKGFKKGFFKTIELFTKKENQAKYKTTIFTI